MINLSDPDRWVLEHVLPGVGGRTLGGAGHSDIVRCSYLNTKVSVQGPMLSRRADVCPFADFCCGDRRRGWSDLSLDIVMTRHGAAIAVNMAQRRAELPILG